MVRVLLATKALSREGIIGFTFCIESSRGWSVASLNGHVKGQRWGDDKEAGSCFGGLYPGQGHTAVLVGPGDKFSVSLHTNCSTELEAGESWSFLPSTVLPWRGRRKPASSFTCRNHWLKGNNSSFWGVYLQPTCWCDLHPF